MMRNFVDFENQYSLFPSLFIGYVGWPYELSKVTLPPDDMEMPQMISMVHHQTAGNMCNRLSLFGVFFSLKDLDLYQMALRYGYENLWSPKWSELVDWQAAIKRFGLRFELREYEHMQEAFMPFGGQSAYDYARRKNLSVILPTGGRSEKCRKVFPSYDDLHKYLKDAYEAARRWRPDWKAPGGLDSLIGSVYDPPCGAIVYENSD